MLSENKYKIERELSSAISTRQRFKLRRAIRRAEKSQYRAELEEKLQNARTVMQELDDIETLKKFHRDKIVEVVKSGDIASMEEELKNVKLDGFEEDLKEDIENLELALKRKYLQKRLQGSLNVAIQFLQNLDLMRLRRAVEEATTSGFLKELGLDIEQANDILSKLERIQLIKRSVMDLTASHIAEIKSYTAPPVQVHKLLMGLLIVLGEDPDVVRDWFEIQVILVRTGKNSLKRRVQEFRADELAVSTAKRVAKLLSDIDSKEINGISKAAKVFYLWTSADVDDKLSTDIYLK